MGRPHGWNRPRSDWAWHPPSEIADALEYTFPRILTNNRIMSPDPFQLSLVSNRCICSPVLGRHRNRGRKDRLDSIPPPSEPDVQISRIRLSS